MSLRRRHGVGIGAGDRARTYAEVAAMLGMHRGTVSRHLERTRRLHPHLYAAVMTVRAEQLAQRHATAVERAAAHSRQWHRRQAARRYREQFGCWPWER